MFNSKIYHCAPGFLQNSMISARALMRNFIREGFFYRSIVKEIDKTQWFNKKDLGIYQEKKMQALLRCAIQKVPYYRRLFREHSLNLKDFNKIDDLKKIPFLGKKDIINNVHELTAKNYKGFKIKGSTSGTTGTPVTIFHDLFSVISENAFNWRQLHWAGFRKGQRRVWIRGDMVVSSEQKRAPFWRFNSIDKMLMMSSYHLSKESAQEYINVLESFDPVVIQAYPSSIGYLARYLDNVEKKYKGTNLKAIVTSSETLNEDNKKNIEKCFNCRCYDSYGLYERAVAIHTCEIGNYHTISDYGIVEFLPKKNGTMEIVGTGFSNRLMPLLRYRTGDSVIMEDESCECPCGRKFPLVKKVIGRMDDSIKTNEGRSVVRLGHIFKGIKHLVEAQIIQDCIDEIKILVVPHGIFDQKDEIQLRSNAKRRIGKNMRVTIKQVPQIQRGKNGKLRNIICNI